MFVPVVCMTCHMPINHLADIFSKMRKDHIAAEFKKTGISQHMSGFITTNDITFGSILDELGIKNLCCRITMMSTVSMEETITKT